MDLQTSPIVVAAVLLNLKGDSNLANCFNPPACRRQGVEAGESESFDQLSGALEKTRNYETNMLPFCQNISHIVPEYLTNKLPDIPQFVLKLIICYAAASYQPMFWQKDSVRLKPLDLHLPGTMDWSRCHAYQLSVSWMLLPSLQMSGDDPPTGTITPRPW